MDTIQDLKDQIADLQAKLKRLENEPIKRKEGDEYFYVCDELITAIRKIDTNSLEDNSRFKFGNYYTKVAIATAAANHQRAQGKIKSFLHTAANGWEPDWNDPQQLKFYVYYESRYERWSCASAMRSQNVGVVYLPSRDVAEKVVDYLNEFDYHLS